MNEISVTLLCSDSLDFKIRFKIIRNIINIFIYSPLKFIININWFKYFI